MDRLKKYGLQNVASEAAGAEMPGAMADSSKRLRDDSIASFDMAFDDEPWDLPCGGVLTGSSASGSQQVISPKVLVLRRSSCRRVFLRSRNGARLCVSCRL